jgi:hypothetical protein
MKTCELNTPRRCDGQKTNCSRHASHSRWRNMYSCIECRTNSGQCMFEHVFPRLFLLLAYCCRSPDRTLLLRVHGGAGLAPELACEVLRVRNRPDDTVASRTVRVSQQLLVRRRRPRRLAPARGGQPAAARRGTARRLRQRRLSRRRHSSQGGGGCGRRGPDGGEGNEEELLGRQLEAGEALRARTRRELSGRAAQCHPPPPREKNLKNHWET